MHMPKKVYLAGPMSGFAEYNFPAFFRYAKQLEDAGFEVFNPAQNDLDKWGDLESVMKNFNYRESLNEELGFLTKTADLIAMMPGWERSNGARAEHATAVACNLGIIYLS